MPRPLDAFDALVRHRWLALLVSGVILAAAVAAALPAFTSSPAADHAALHGALRVAGLAVVFLGLALWGLMRTRRFLLAVPIVPLGGVVIAFGAVGLTGRDLGSLVFALPSVIFALLITGVVHLPCVTASGPHAESTGRDRVVKGLRRAWGPALLTTLTSAIGLLALTSSSAAAVRALAAFAAVGVFAALPLAFVISAMLLDGDAPGLRVAWARRCDAFLQSCHVLIRRHPWRVWAAVGIFGVVATLPIEVRLDPTGSSWTIWRAALVALASQAIALLVWLRSARLALIGLLPSLFAILVIRAIMGALGLTLDLATATVCAVAVVVSIDETTHFLRLWRRAERRGLVWADALHHTLTRCGPAVLTTTALLCATYAAPSIIAGPKFAGLAALLLLAAWATLAGVLLLLPLALRLWPARHLKPISRRARLKALGFHLPLLPTPQAEARWELRIVEDKPRRWRWGRG